MCPCESDHRNTDQIFNDHPPGIAANQLDRQACLLNNNQDGWSVVLQALDQNL